MRAGSAAPAIASRAASTSMSFAHRAGRDARRSRSTSIREVLEPHLVSSVRGQAPLRVDSRGRHARAGGAEFAAQVARRAAAGHQLHSDHRRSRRAAADGALALHAAAVRTADLVRGGRRAGARSRSIGRRGARGRAARGRQHRTGAGAGRQRSHGVTGRGDAAVAADRGPRRYADAAAGGRGVVFRRQKGAQPRGPGGGAAPDGVDVEGPRGDQRRRRPRGARQSRCSPAISNRWRARSPAIARAMRSARSIAP